MTKEQKYLNQIRLYRIEHQVMQSAFEMALYIDYFGYNSKGVDEIFNSTFDVEEFTEKEKNNIFKRAKELIKEQYNLEI